MSKRSDNPTDGMNLVLTTICSRYGYGYTGYKRHHGINVYTAVYREADGTPHVITALTPYYLTAIMHAAPQRVYSGKRPERDAMREELQAG